MPGKRVLLLGGADVELESNLALGIAGEVDCSASGREVPAAVYDVVALSRDAARDRRRRGRLLAAAARAVQPGGVVIAEFPNLLGRLSRPVLLFEGLGGKPLRARGGTTLGGCHRLLAAAGLRRQSSFLCLPHLADPRVVLPLDSPPALAYHYAPPFFVESGRRRLLRRLLGAAGRAGLLARLSPGFTLFATREASS